MNLETAMFNAVNRLAKWRMIFTGWQLGTRAKGDPEGDAVRDHREATILLRCELNALTKVLVDSKVVKIEDWQRQMIYEADMLSQQFERKFPGFKAEDYGISAEVEVIKETTKGWRP